MDKFVFSQSVRQEIRTQLGIGNQLVFGHVGRFKASKNHAFLLKVFREVLRSEPDAILLLVGDGKLEETIRHQAQEMKSTGGSAFWGARSDIAQLLQAMDVFLFPSLYEGLRIALIEAQAAGLPCLASDRVPKEAKAIDSLKWMSWMRRRLPGQIRLSGWQRQGKAGTEVKKSKLQAITSR